MGLSDVANMAQVCLLLLLLALDMARPAFSGRPPTLPTPITGRPGCVQPIKALQCIRDSRSKFVAGVGTSYGTGFNFKYVCSDGGVNTFLGLPEFQEVWDMSAPTDPGFPTLPNGEPDLRFFYPEGAPITQMIVLQAPNPFGPMLGKVAAIIFIYLTDQPKIGKYLDYAICGNADYAMAYLDPPNNPLPPTPVSLQAQYTNPLAAELPPRFLGSFEGFCGLLGRNYLFGDPYGISKNALKFTFKACFAAEAPFVKNPGPPPVVPLIRVQSNFTPNENASYSCQYDKHNTKSPGTSYSCAALGLSIPTGKWSALRISMNDTLSGWQRDEATGQVSVDSQPELYEGTQRGEVVAAPLPPDA